MGIEPPKILMTPEVFEGKKPEVPPPQTIQPSPQPDKPPPQGQTTDWEQPWPATKIDDSNEVLATPIGNVYEHGFWQGAFRVNAVSGGGDPNNTAPNFQIFVQWIEVLPADQMVPVLMTYDPISGCQM